MNDIDKDIKYLVDNTIQLLSKDNVLYFGLLVRKNIFTDYIIIDYCMKYTKQKLIHSDFMYSQFYKSVKKEDFINALKLEDAMQMEFKLKDIKEISLINSDWFVWLCEEFKEFRNFREKYNPNKINPPSP
ncbi:MAG: hypothetical protein WCQ95_12745 [Bacteroidota bacterium]